jgi:hypothetical protein
MFKAMAIGGIVTPRKFDLTHGADSEPVSPALGSTTRASPPATLKIIVMSALLGLVASAPSDVWRLGYVAGQDEWNGAFQAIVRIPVVVVIAFALLDIVVRRRFLDDGFIIVLVCACAQASLVGLLQTDGRVEWQPFIADTLGIMLIGCAYAAPLSWQPKHDWWLEQAVSRISKLLVIVGAVSTALFFRSGQIGDVYWALVVPMTLPFAWFLSSGNYRWASAAAVLVLMNGKRGITLELVWALSVFCLIGAMSRRTRSRKGDVFSLASVGVGLALALYLVSTGAVQSLIEPMQATVARYSMLLDLRGDVSVMSSGRSDELLSAWDAFSARPFNWVLGAGHGWQFWTPASIGSEEMIHLRYVHLSPANFLFKYGIVITGIGIGVVLVRLVKQFRWITSTTDANYHLYRALFMYLVASLAGGMTGYTYVVLPFIWLSFGLLHRRSNLAVQKVGPAMRRTMRVSG